jgi:hypothetical protein
MNLIESVSSRLGLSARAAEGAVGSVLALVKLHAPAETFAVVEERAPEIQSWMAVAAEAPGEGGGLLGGVLGSMLGAGGLGGLAASLGANGPLGNVVASLSRYGVNADKVGTLVPLIVQFLRSKVGDAVVGKLLAAVPILPNLAGGSPGSRALLARFE